MLKQRLQNRERVCTAFWEAVSQTVEVVSILGKTQKEITKYSRRKFAH